MVSADERQLLSSRPSFDLPFPLMGGRPFRMPLFVENANKPRKVSRAGARLSLAMLGGSSSDVVCDANVELPVFKLGNVDPVALRLRRVHGLRLRSGHSTRP